MCRPAGTDPKTGLWSVSVRSGRLRLAWSVASLRLTAARVELSDRVADRKAADPAAAGLAVVSCRRAAWRRAPDCPVSAGPADFAAASAPAAWYHGLDCP